MTASLFTPSAKSHERVTGRWVRDIQAADKNEWTIYYAKLAFGTAVPWLMTLLAASIFVSRAAAEVAAWAAASLCAFYILADIFSRTREFRFFRVGSDLMLLGVFAIGLAGAFSAGSIERGADAVGGLRWIPLLYLLTYGWELFPGLNRAFGAMAAVAGAAAILALWQMFAGVDIATGHALSAAPIAGRHFFAATGFFDSPEALGTALAVFLPLPAMAFTLSDRRAWLRWGSLALTGLVAMGIFATFRPGLWIAGGAGIFVALVMPGHRRWAILLALAVVAGAASVALQASPDELYGGVAREHAARASKQREQINEQVQIWSKNPWIGAGLQSVDAAKLDATVGNVYFQILAQTGALGLSFYLLFCLGFLLSAYRILQEVPRTHYWHRVLVSGGIAGLAAFHVAGLFWFTLSEALSANLFCFLAAALSYVHEHYSRGFVPDDYSL
jgi:hypothetical protein